MEAGKEGYKKEYRDITIRTTEGSTLTGKVNIGIKDRVSELFTKADTPFIILFDAEYSNVTGKVFFINKSNIVWVEPNS